jgi:hypothetical protein
MWVGRPGFRSDYRTSSPVTAWPISIRWTSLVPSKIVDRRAVFAGRRPVD